MPEYSLLFIDFHAKEQEIIEQNMQEAEDLVYEIRCAKNNGSSLEEMKSMLNQYQYSHIERAANNNGYDFDEVLEHILEDEMYARAILAKSAGRTGYQEKLQFDTLATQSMTCMNWDNLPNGGTAAISLKDGNIVAHRQGNTKSVDFYAQTADNEHEVLVAAKYTDEDGGAQDNQARDLEAFAANAPEYGGNFIVVLLADGAYYTRNKLAYGNMDFISYINETYTDKNVIATTTEMFDISLGAFLDGLYSVDGECINAPY